MLRLALLLAVVFTLSACEWAGRPDGKAPPNGGAMVFEPEAASSNVYEEPSLDDGMLVEPLDGTALPGPSPSTTMTEGTLPEAPATTATEAPDTGLPGQGASDLDNRSDLDDR